MASVADVPDGDGDGLLVPGFVAAAAL